MLTWIRQEAAATQGAGGVGQEPSVNALNVKRVLAFGQQPETIVVTELRQANRTVGAVLQSPYASITEDRERVDERLLHARVVQVEQVLQLADCLYLDRAENILISGSSIPNWERTRVTICVASREWPPNSKKLS